MTCAFTITHHPVVDLTLVHTGVGIYDDLLLHPENAGIPTEPHVGTLGLHVIRCWLAVGIREDG